MSNSILAAFFTDIASQPSDTNASVVINLSTLLSVICWIFLTAFIVSQFSKELKAKFIELLDERVFFLAWLVPTVAMVLSLYFSEFLGWRPCTLCWYQRAVIYTLSIVTLLYYFKRAKILRIVGYILAIVGPIISLYHVLLEKYPEIEGGPTCDPNNPCASPWFTSMGFLTTAGMALTASITVGVLLYLSSKVEKTSSL